MYSSPFSSVGLAAEEPLGGRMSWYIGIGFSDVIQTLKRRFAPIYKAYIA